MSEVRAFKLINGQEIIGLCSTLNSGTIEMEKVREIAPMDDGKGGWNLSLMPFLMSSIDGTFELRLSGVVGEIQNLPVALDKEYRNAVSKIKIATSING
jgi:hypothetical protein